MARLSSPKLNKNINTAGANESRSAPTNMRLRILEPSTRLRWSASNFTMFRNSRTSNVRRSRNANTESGGEQEDLAGAVGAQEWRKGIEGIQGSQHQQKQEHASAERYNGTPAVLGFRAHAILPVCLTDYSAGEDGGYDFRRVEGLPSAGSCWWRELECLLHAHKRSGGTNRPSASLALQGVHLEQEFGVVAGLAQAVDQ